MYRSIRDFRVDGISFSIDPVSIPCTIQVFGIGDMSEDVIETYFTNSRSGATGDIETQVPQRSNCALVTFETAASKLLCRTHLERRNCSLLRY